MKKAIKVVITSVLCIAVLGGVYMYTKKSASASGGKGGPGGMPGKSAGSRGGQNTVSVKTMTAKKDVLHDYVNTNGEIETQSSVEVFPDIGGKVTSVNISLGSNVQKGQILAQIDPSKPGAQYAKSPVLSPISGTVTACSIKQGNTVTTNTTIAVIGDVSNLQVVANIPERYVATLKKGLKANIVLEAYPNQIFKATVTKVSPLVDKSKRTKEVTLNFDNPDERINAGMFAKVTLYTQDYTGEIVVPSSSIVNLNGKQCLFVVRDDNTAEHREIVTGNSVDNYIQILSGIKEGEKVVIEGMRVLSDGSPVKEVGMTPKTEDKAPAPSEKERSKKDAPNGERKGGER